MTFEGDGAGDGGLGFDRCDLTDAGERFDVTTGGLDELQHLGRRMHRDALLRLDALTGADRTDGGDEGVGPFEAGDDRPIDDADRDLGPRGPGEDLGGRKIDTDGRTAAGSADVGPQGLGDERRDRVQHPENRIEDRAEDDLLDGVVVDGGLDGLEVAVADISPDEVVERVDERVELVVVEGLLGVVEGLAETGEDPAIDEPGVGDRNGLGGGGGVGQSLQREAGGVPGLVGEVASDVELRRGVASERLVVGRGRGTGGGTERRDHGLRRISGGGLDGGGDEVARRGLLERRGEGLAGVRADHVDRHPDVLGVGGHLDQREAHGVGAVAVDDVSRVDAVAEGLGHLLPVTVLDHGVDEDVGERQLAVHEVPVEHDHPADPQRDDLSCGGEDRRGVERIEQSVGVGIVLGPRPRHGRHRPQSRGEPGVEDVGIADEPVGFEGGDEAGFVELVGPTIESGQRGVGWDADRFLDLVFGDAANEVGRAGI